MTKLSDIIPEKNFSIEHFRQYAQKRNVSVQNIFYALIGASIIAPIAGTIAWIYTNNTYTELDYNILICTMTTLMIWVFACIPTMAITSMMAIFVTYYNEYVEPELIQKYNNAWDNTVKPQMIQSIAKFDRLSTNLTENQTNTPEYVEMYTLSEQIREEIRQHPTLTTLTDFDVTPDFIKLNNIMKNYTQNPA